jgi:hypothetical protein
MRDFGIDKGIVKEFQTSDRRSRGLWYGFRKMFWYYLKKLNVPFSDPCCPEADGSSSSAPVRYNTAEGRFEYYNGTAWVDVLGFTTSTTTSTTAAPTSTTTTTTAP